MRGLSMTYVTKITLKSGDRVVLDDTATDIKAFAKRKGADLTGPHPRPPIERSVPLTKCLSEDGGRFGPWTYMVYTRDLEIKGHDGLARAVAARGYPEQIHVSIELDQAGSIH